MKKTQNNIVRLKPLVMPMIVARKYAAELSALVRAMVKDYQSIIEIYKDDRGQATGDDMVGNLDVRFNALGREWAKRFAEYAKNNTPKTIQKILKSSDLQIKSVLKDWFAEKRFTLFGRSVPLALRQVLKASVQENVSLIKSLPAQYEERVRGAVYRTVAGGGTLKNLRAELVKYARMTDNRAKLVASDQTHKAFVSIAAKRMETVGIRKFEWIHTHSGKTQRPYHMRRWDGVSGKKDGHPNGLNGFIFDLEHLPIIDEKTMERGLPGRLPFCYHKDTEVYTERGFVPIKDVFVGEKVLTLNPITKIPEWSVCETKTEKFSEYVVEIHNPWWKMAVDPEHRFFVYKKRYNGKNTIKGSFYPAWVDGYENLSNNCNFYAGAEWIGEEKEYMVLESSKYPMDDFLRLLAWYLTEGSVDNRPEHHRVSISQKTHLDTMFEGLTAFSPHKTKAGINIYNKDIKKYLAQFGKSGEKFIPDFVKGLSKRQIRLFLDAFALGDGSLGRVRGWGRNGPLYKTGSKRMADDLAELVIKTGAGVSIGVTRQKGKKSIFKGRKITMHLDIYTVSEKFHVWANAKRLTKDIVSYNDKVYDIGVKENHTILTKYKGCILWNSNCHCRLSPVIEMFD